MEAEPIVRIYKSRLWRRNPFFEAVNQISFKHEKELIIASVEMQKTQTMLDLACGPGIYSRSIARELPEKRIIGIDLSWAMLKYADQQATREGIQNLVLVRADASALPILPQTIDAAICCGALHLFLDPKTVLTELFRTLHPGSRLVLAVFRRSEGKTAIWRDRIRCRLYGISSFTEKRLKSLLEDTGFRNIHYPHAKGIWMIASAERI